MTEAGRMRVGAIPKWTRVGFTTVSVLRASASGAGDSVPRTAACLGGERARSIYFEDTSSDLKVASEPDVLAGAAYHDIDLARFHHELHVKVVERELADRQGEGDCLGLPRLQMNAAEAG